MFFFTVKQSIFQRASLWFIAQELAVRLHMGLHLVSVLLFLKRLYLDYLHSISIGYLGSVDASFSSLYCNRSFLSERKKIST